MVSEERLELSCLAASAPKAGVSTNFTTPTGGLEESTKNLEKGQKRNSLNKG